MEILDFNGKEILYTTINGVNWIALKPVCEALNVDYNRQFQNVKGHKVFGPAFANQQMQVGGQRRKMACLPEELIYGWLFSINSDSEELLAYQMECNHILFNHFHGMITRRKELYTEIARSKKQVLELEEQLRQDETFQQWVAIKMSVARLWKNLKGTTDDELTLFDE